MDYNMREVTDKYFFNAQVIEPYIFCYQPIETIQNNFLCSNSKAIMLRPN